MRFLPGLFALLLLFSTRETNALDCYTCTNATHISECKSTATCNAGEICFSDHDFTSNGMRYSFGCRSETSCKTVIGNKRNAGNTAGRSGKTKSCSDCCKEHHCNKKLCLHSYSEKECADSTGIQCSTVGAMIDMCSDTEKANTVCRRFCGLCNYETQVVDAVNGSSNGVIAKKVNGQWSAWFSWSNCDVTCGTGTKVRMHSCSEPAPSGGGQFCVGPKQDTDTCTKEPCPIHGSWAEWTPWGSCSASCDIGLRKRDRTCSNPYPARFGDHCYGDEIDYQICQAVACAETNGAWGTWSVWSRCSTTCNTGIRTRLRNCDGPAPSAGGKYCRGSPHDVQQCAIKACPRKVSAFTVKAPRDGYCKIGKVYIAWKKRDIVYFCNVEFRSVLLNEGNRYSNGNFTCLYPGLYYFEAHLTAKDSGENLLACMIQKNTQSIVKFNQLKGTFSASGVTTLHLLKGDVVHVRCTHHSSYMDTSSAFSGFLVRPDP